MDPVTQGALGAAAAQAILGPKLGRRTWLLGALGGMAADLDVLIRSPTDPLMAIEFHRHFTHSLAFVPIGGLIVALPWLARKKNRPDARLIVAATTIGYATHGLLDAFTTYGTLLWWPFARTRVAWNTIGIIDLTYTLPLLLGVWLAVRRDRRRPAVVALALTSLYMALCGLQAWRAQSAAYRLADSRGHAPTRAEVMPTVLQNKTWRSIYEADGMVYADRIRVPWFGTPRVDDGEQAPALRTETLDPKLLEDPKDRRTFEVLMWFSRGWLAQPPGD
ncbi:MAG: metal-dependent hydrolase, partial [Nannocystaceae bacterium]